MYGYAAEQKPRFMEFTTWNDYLEGSYLGGPYTLTHSPVATMATTSPMTLSASWAGTTSTGYEAGVRPTISKDFIAIAHRPHAENAPRFKRAVLTAWASPTDSEDYSLVDFGMTGCTLW